MPVQFGRANPFNPYNLNRVSNNIMLLRMLEINGKDQEVSRYIMHHYDMFHVSICQTGLTKFPVPKFQLTFHQSSLINAINEFTLIMGDLEAPDKSPREPCLLYEQVACRVLDYVNTAFEHLRLRKNWPIEAYPETEFVIPAVTDQIINAPGSRSVTWVVMCLWLIISNKLFPNGDAHHIVTLFNSHLTSDCSSMLWLYIQPLVSYKMQVPFTKVTLEVSRTMDDQGAPTSRWKLVLRPDAAAFNEILQSDSFSQVSASGSLNKLASVAAELAPPEEKPEEKKRKIDVSVE